MARLVCFFGDGGGGSVDLIILFTFSRGGVDRLMGL